MIVIIGIWALTIGYGLAYLGVQKFQGKPATFGDVFLPTFLSKKAATAA